MTKKDISHLPRNDLDHTREEAADFAGVGIYRYREDGTIVFMDRASLRLLDLDEEYPDPNEVIGRDIGELLVRLEPPGALRQAVRDHGRAKDFEYHYRTLSGKERWAMHNSYIVHDPVTGERQIQVLAKDITALKEAAAKQKELEQRTHQARKMESLGVLAGGIAHDFNNLLAAILGNAELARIQLHDPRTVDGHLTALMQAASQAAGLCQQLLAYAGKSALDIRPLDLNAVVRESIGLVRLSTARRIPLNIELAEEGLPALGDPSSIRQILLNLVTNASEAMDKSAGCIRVTTGKAHRCQEELERAQGGRDLAPAEYCFLTVEDEGPGMDPATAARIFEPFFTTKFTGRGLGLASVLGILGKLGGAIEVDTAPGLGTRFTALFPTSAQQQPAPSISHSEQTRGNPRGSVLLVDDEPLVLQTLNAMLQTLGFSVVKAADGLEALERFQRHHSAICLCLLDLTMPGMDGAETAARIRALDPHMPIVFSSGHDNRGHTDDLRGNGPVSFLKKPYSIALLEAALNKALSDSVPEPVSKA